MDTVRITPIGNLVHSGSWATDMLHSHDFHRLIWVTRGQGPLVLNAAQLSYLPYSVTFIPAGLTHSFVVKPGVFGIAIDIPAHANLDMPQDAFSLRLRDVSEQRRFSALVDTLQTELNRPADPKVADLNVRALRHQAGLMGVWIERRMRSRPQPAKASPSNRLVQKFLHLIELRLGLGDNIAGYSALLEVTPTHLTRCCRKSLGKSALEVLNERVHHAARMLLLTTDIPVKDIANQLGFASAAYFTRAFQNTVQETPSDFRATRKRKSEPDR